VQCIIFFQEASPAHINIKNHELHVNFMSLEIIDYSLILCINLSG
jgi:hypothetical protein